MAGEDCSARNAAAPEGILIEDLIELTWSWEAPEDWEDEIDVPDDYIFYLKPEHWGGYRYFA